MAAAGTPVKTSAEIPARREREELMIPLRKFIPTYYEKSDGYKEYLTEVNKITGTEACAEMIRGGQAAYRYIIASTNEDIYKPKSD